MMKLQFCMDLVGVGVKTVSEWPEALKPQKNHAKRSQAEVFS